MPEALNSTMEGRGKRLLFTAKPSSMIADFRKITGSKNLGDEEFLSVIVLAKSNHDPEFESILLAIG